MSRFIGSHSVAAAVSKSGWVYAIPSCPRLQRCGSAWAQPCTPGPALSRTAVALQSVAPVFCRRSLVLVDWLLAPIFPSPKLVMLQRNSFPCNTINKQLCGGQAVYGESVGWIYQSLEQSVSCGHQFIASDYPSSCGHADSMLVLTLLSWLCERCCQLISSVSSQEINVLQPWSNLLQHNCSFAIFVNRHEVLLALRNEKICQALLF